MAAINEYNAPVIDMERINPEEFAHCKFIPDFLSTMRTLIWFNPETPANHSIYVKPSGLLVWGRAAKNGGKWRNIDSDIFVEAINRSLIMISLGAFRELFKTEKYAIWQKAKSAEMYTVLSYFFGGDDPANAEWICGLVEPIKRS